MQRTILLTLPFYVDALVSTKEVTTMFNQKSKTLFNSHKITPISVSHNRSAFLTKLSMLSSGWFSVPALFLTTLFVIGNSMNAAANNTESFVENEFIMNDPSGNPFSRQVDIVFGWDGSLYTDPHDTNYS